MERGKTKRVRATSAWKGQLGTLPLACVSNDFYFRDAFDHMQGRPLPHKGPGTNADGEAKRVILVSTSCGSSRALTRVGDCTDFHFNGAHAHMPDHPLSSYEADSKEGDRRRARKHRVGADIQKRARGQAWAATSTSGARLIRRNTSACAE